MFSLKGYAMHTDDVAERALELMDMYKWRLIDQYVAMGGSKDRATVVVWKKSEIALEVLRLQGFLGTMYPAQRNEGLQTMGITEKLAIIIHEVQNLPKSRVDWERLKGDIYDLALLTAEQENRYKIFFVDGNTLSELLTFAARKALVEDFVIDERTTIHARDRNNHENIPHPAID